MDSEYLSFIRMTLKKLHFVSDILRDISHKSRTYPQKRIKNCVYSIPCICCNEYYEQDQLPSKNKIGRLLKGCSLRRDIEISHDIMYEVKIVAINSCGLKSIK